MHGTIDFGKLKSMQDEIARQFSDEDIALDEIKYIAGFEVSFAGANCVTAAVVLEYKTMKVVERKHLVSKAPMNYVPGFLAFREGPSICQLYYDLEYEPDVIIVNGHGIAHPMNCGLATFVGVELGKPVIGVAKSLLIGEEKEGEIMIEGQSYGKAVKTKEHANPLYVSQGNLIGIDTAVEIVKRCVIPPHKLPEPLHAAHRYAKRAAEEQRAGKQKIVQEEQIESE